MHDLKREVDRQVRWIRSVADEIVPEEELKILLERSLVEGTPLRVKYGIDPTNPNIHIGHLVPCRLLRIFQDLGHVAVLIIGDYTARVGDPTGRNVERPALSEEEVAYNMKLYSEQLFRVVDEARAEVHLQSDWFAHMKFDTLLSILSQFSVAQMLSHETFRVRVESGNRLSLHELLYPVMQAYDSVRVGADMEIGGSDQRFNCLCGRDLQRSHGMPPQVVVTVPLLPGTDGRKMSKSFGNHISLDLDAEEMVGKVMSIPDTVLADYVSLATNWNVSRKEEALDGFGRGDIHPRTLKLEIAEEIARQFHGPRSARNAAESFERVFARRERPENIVQFTIDADGVNIVDLLVLCGFGGSRSEARRLVSQRGVRIDNRVVDSIEERIVPAAGRNLLLQVGKRRFAELVGGSETEGSVAFR